MRAGTGVLLQSALLGTGRRPPPELGLLGTREGESAERRLLREAGVLALQARAGARAATVPALPEPAPDESRPVCPPEASADLPPMLWGAYAVVLPEWLDALAARGAVVPHPYLRDFLDRGGRPGIAVRLEPVLSERARWLAVLHPDWAWAQAGTPLERWRRADRPRRLVLLRVLRATDPARGRELLEAVWKGESARDRETYLAELRTGLAQDDEPFLERLLDGRQTGLRPLAGRLLSGIPGSALQRRMRERLGATELDDAMRRDGLTDRPPPGMGRSAWIRWQVAAAAPLPPPDERPETLLEVGDTARSADAMAEAAVRQRDDRWAARLLDEELPVDRYAPLLRVAPRPAAEQAVLDRLGAGSVADALADALPDPWSAALTEALVERWLRMPQPPAWAGLVGSRGHPAASGLLQRALEQMDASSPGLRRAADALAMLDFRSRMLDHLKP